MTKALDAVRRGHLTSYAAAKAYGVPRTTLHDRLMGRVADDAVPGGKTILSSAEELTLCDFVVRSAQSGFPLQRVDLKKWVKQILALDGRPNPFKDGCPGKEI
jgi:hypothetical protein